MLFSCEREALERMIYRDCEKAAGTGKVQRKAMHAQDVPISVSKLLRPFVYSPLHWRPKESEEENTGIIGDKRNEGRLRCHPLLEVLNTAAKARRPL